MEIFVQLVPHRGVQRELDSESAESKLILDKVPFVPAKLPRTERRKAVKEGSGSGSGWSSRMVTGRTGYDWKQSTILKPSNEKQALGSLGSKMVFGIVHHFHRRFAPKFCDYFSLSLLRCCLDTLHGNHGLKRSEFSFNKHGSPLEFP